MRLGVIHKVEVDQLLQLQIVSLHAVNDVREERADVLPDRHAGYDLLNGILLLVSLVTLEIKTELS